MKKLLPKETLHYLKERGFSVQVREEQDYAEAFYSWYGGMRPRFYTGLVEAIKNLARMVAHEMVCSRRGHKYQAEYDDESGALVGHYCTRCGWSADYDYRPIL